MSRLNIKYFPLKTQAAAAAASTRCSSCIKTSSTTATISVIPLNGARQLYSDRRSLILIHNRIVELPTHTPRLETAPLFQRSRKEQRIEHLLDRLHSVFRVLARALVLLHQRAVVLHVAPVNRHDRLNYDMARLVPQILI